MFKISVILWLTILDVSGFIAISANIPSHKETILEESIELECNIDDCGEDCEWAHIPVGSDEIYEVIIGNVPIRQYEDRFSISEIGHYKLLIKNVQSVDAGTYICRKRKVNKETRITLTILDNPPACYSNRSSEIPIAQNDCGWDRGSISLYCKVKYSGVIAPVLIWKSIGGKTYNVNNNQVVNTVHKRAICWTDFIFTCHTEESKQSCHTTISKPLYAFNTTETRTIHWPQTVVCKANSSEICSYKWIHKGGVISVEKDLELLPSSPTGEYLCFAECGSVSSSCVIQANQLTYDFASNTWDHAGRLIYTHVVFAVTVLLIFVFAKSCWVKIQQRISKSMIILWRILKRKISRSNKRRSKNQTYKSVDPIEEGPESLELNEEKKSDVRVIERETVETNSIDFKSVRLTMLKYIQSDKHIKGVTVLKNIIYVVKYASKDIDRYDATSFEGPFPFHVPELMVPRDLVSCTKTNSLYVSDCSQRGVHKLSIQDKIQSHWATEFAPEGLHVMSNTNMLVVFQRERLLIEFTADGEKIKMIELPKLITNPRHAIFVQTTNQYIVCYGEQGDQINGVCSIDSNGQQISKNHIDKRYMERVDNMKMWPTRVAETKNGIIVLTDHHTDLQLFDTKLQFMKVVLEIDGKSTSRMFLDNDKHRLYVTENTEQGRILIYNLKSGFLSWFNFI